MLTRFEPWMALSFTEGSIGGDIERIDLDAAGALLFGGTAQTGRVRCPATARPARFQRHRHRAGADHGRQGAAADQPAHQLLLPLRAAGDQRRGAQRLWRRDLGAVLHLPGLQRPRRLDAHVERRRQRRRVRRAVERQRQAAELSLRQRRGGRWRRGRSPSATAPRTADWRRAASPPGARIAARSSAPTNGRWIAFAMMDRPVEALQQSFLRTKATDLLVPQVARLQANSSNNTIFADDKGEIAYLHPQFVPRRDDRFDYTKPVDGSDPATDWGALHRAQRAAQRDQPAQRLGPEHQQLAVSRGRRVQPEPATISRNIWTCSARISAASTRVQLLDRQPRLDARKAAGGGVRQLSARLCRARSRRWSQAYDALPDERSAARAAGRARSRVLRGWDYRWGAESVAAERWPSSGASTHGGAQAPPDETGNKVMMRLGARHQRRAEARRRSTRRSLGCSAISAAGRCRGARSTASSASRRRSIQPFSDAAPSIPVPFADGNYGSLASFGARAEAGHEALVRQLRQQLRRGGRVRTARPRARGHRRRRKRRSRLAPFQRPGRALRVRQSARRSISTPTSSTATPSGRYRPGE